MFTLALIRKRKRGRFLKALALVAGIAALAAPTASATTRTFNVNPATGSDSNSGSPTSPLKTLTRALTKARSGDTIQLAGGTYSAATGERFSTVNGTPTVTVPSGVTINGNAGKGLGTDLLGAPNQVGLALRGSATISEVSALGFGVGLEASQGTQSLEGMHFTGGGIRLTGTANTTLTGAVHLDPNFFTASGQTIFKAPDGAAISVNDQAQFTMTGGDLFSRSSLGDGVPNCDITQKGIFASGSARVTINSVLFDDLAAGALDLTGQTQAAINGSSILAQYDSNACQPAAAVRTLDTAFLKVANSTIESNQLGSVTLADGIRALSSRDFRFDGSRVSGFRAHGIVEGPNSGGAELNAATLTGNDSEFDGGDAKVALNTIFNSSIDNNVGPAVTAFDLTMRNTQVTDTNGNGVALTITGPHADLGTASDPGLNVFQGNFLTSVLYDPSVSSGTIDAVGDEWEAGVQGAQAFGFYNDPVTFAGGSPFARGQNFTLTQPGQTINLGPLFIGRLDLTPKVLHARAGRAARLVVAWTHPTDWRQLRSIELRLYAGAKRIGGVTIQPHTLRVTASGLVALVPGGSRVMHSGRTVTARLAMRLARSLGGRSLRLAVQATDVNGRRQLDAHAGVIRVTT